MLKGEMIMAKNNSLIVLMTALVLTMSFSSMLAMAAMGGDSSAPGSDAITINRSEPVPLMRSTTNAQRQAAAARIANVRNAIASNSTYDWQINETQAKLLEKPVDPSSYAGILYALVISYIFIISIVFYFGRKRNNDSSEGE
jgi:hypothetical protein